MRNFTRFFKSKFEVVFPIGYRKNNKILILGRGEELENVNLSTGFFQTPVNSILYPFYPVTVLLNLDRECRF
jgi:hypothetical protein